MPESVLVKHTLNRRRFLKTSALFAAPWIVPASALGRDGATAASERIQLGVIGLGSRGFNLLDQFLALSDCRITAVCDVDERHHRELPAGKGKAFGRIPGREQVVRAYANAKSASPEAGIVATADFREICDQESIDAVVVATPDHWHAPISLAGLRAGKDVYCEKPVTHLFAEGQTLCREVADRKAVFQTGSQQRSEWVFRRAVELVRNGLLGTVTSVEVGLPAGYDKPQGSTGVSEPPASCDYDLWCGPSPLLPYMPARHHRWWRGSRAFGGGVLMDWIGHHNDIAHWAIDAERSGPVRVEAVGWTFPDTDVYDTPHQYEIRCEYPGGIRSTISTKNRQGLKLIGDAGWVFVNRGKLEASDTRWIEKDFTPGPAKVYASDDHAANFLECMRSRNACIAPPELSHRSITPGHLGYVSHALGRALGWDAASETCVNDDEANRLLTAVNYRAPWSF